MNLDFLVKSFFLANLNKVSVHIFSTVKAANVANYHVSRNYVNCRFRRSKL